MLALIERCQNNVECKTSARQVQIQKGSSRCPNKKESKKKKQNSLWEWLAFLYIVCDSRDKMKILVPQELFPLILDIVFVAKVEIMSIAASWSECRDEFWQACDVLLDIFLE